MREVALLKDLMIWHLQSLYDAELQWSEALKETATSVSFPELKKNIETGSVQAYRHAAKIGETLRGLDASALSARNTVAGDLVREIQALPHMAADREVLDAAVIVTRQCMNHYMIAKYGTVASFARLLQQEGIAEAMHAIVEEEKAADRALTKLAEDSVNIKARSVIVE